MEKRSEKKKHVAKGSGLAKDWHCLAVILSGL